MNFSAQLLSLGIACTLFLIVFRGHASTAATDSIDIMAVHYQVIINKGESSDMTDMVVYLGDETVAVTKKIVKDGRPSVRKQMYTLGTDRNYVIINAAGQTTMLENAPTKAVDIRRDSTHRVAGVACYKATYKMNGSRQNAFYTDMFGVTFNPIADVPGVALYYEEMIDDIQVKYLADWIKPMRVSKKLMSIPEGADSPKDRVRFRLERNLIANVNGFSWKHDLMEISEIKDLQWLDFTSLDGKKRSERNFNNRLVVAQLSTNASKSGISNAGAMDMAKTFKGQPVKFILLVDGAIGKYKNEKFYRKSNLDIASSTSKFLEKNNLEKDFAYILYDMDGYIKARFQSERNMDLMEDEISWLLRGPAVFHRLGEEPVSAE